MHFFNVENNTYFILFIMNVFLCEEVVISPPLLKSFDFLEVTVDYYDTLGLEHQKSVAGVSVKKSR